MAAAVPKGYCSAAAVAAVLGVPLTPELQAALDPLIAAAEATIDAYTGHAWLEPGDHDEPHLVSRPHLRLTTLPVLAVSGVLWLAQGPTTQDPTLIDPSAYALLGAETGAFWLGPTWAPWGMGYAEPGWSGAPVWLRVQYSSGTDVPPDVAFACAETAAASYRRSTDQAAATAVASGVKRYTVGQELTVEFADAASATTASGGGAALPPAASAALARWRPAMVWA